MRYTPVIDARLGEVRIEIAADCYTDALPLLRHLQIRRLPVDLSCQSIALACALLTGERIGDHFEFAGMKIGGDYAEAIERVIGRRVVVAGVDGFDRTISSGDVDIHCAPAAARSDVPDVRSATPIPFTNITWSGDFVARPSRRSTGFALGDYHTNAGLFADPTVVSIAIGLIHGRDRCRTLWVPATEGSSSRMDAITAALRIVGVTLEIIEPRADNVVLLPVPPRAPESARTKVRPLGRRAAARAGRQTNPAK